MRLTVRSVNKKASVSSGVSYITSRQAKPTGRQVWPFLGGHTNPSLLPTPTAG